MLCHSFAGARTYPTPGDISAALSQHPGAYTLSLGHMQDLTLESFAYLRFPLVLAAVAFLIGASGALRSAARSGEQHLAAAVMMVLFFHAARLAMVTFDPYLSSRPLAEAMLKSPPGKLIMDHHYYTFSSVFFYTNADGAAAEWALQSIWNTDPTPRSAPLVFIDDARVRGNVADSRAVLPGAGPRAGSRD